MNGAPKTLADVISHTEAAMREDDRVALKQETLAQRRRRKLPGACWANDSMREWVLVATDGEILANITKNIGTTDDWYLPMFGVWYRGGNKAKAAVEEAIRMGAQL